MTTTDQRISEATQALADRLTHWGVDDPENRARDFIRLMIRNGWRSTPNALDIPPSRVPRAPAAVRDTALAQMRADITAARTVTQEANQ